MNLAFTPEAWEDFEYWMDNDQEAVNLFNVGFTIVTNKYAERLRQF